MRLKGLLIAIFLLSGCQNKMETSNKSTSLNAPLRFPINLKKIDGKKIVNAIQYQILINLNLTLLEYDKNANLNTLLAENYDIQDNVIIFQIRKGIKTISGYEIKAIDAELSLKRLIKSNDGSHSRLAELLCSEGRENNSCPGISSSEYVLKIVARKKSYIPFILSLLTNADNVIIPLTALDSALPNSHIVNFKETTGPYFIELPTLEDKELDHFKLIANKNHFLYSDKIPQEINYDITDFNSLVSVDKKLKHNFNYIHNVAGLKLSQIKDLEENDETIKIQSTLLLKNTMIFSTEKGRRLFGIKELLFHELKIRDFLLNSKVIYPNITEQQIEYFPLASDGNLTSEQHTKVLNEYNLVKNFQVSSARKVKVGVYQLFYEKYKDELEKLEGISVLLIKGYPLDKNTENVDLFISTIDSSFTESLDLLQYNKTFGVFDVTDEDMRNYIDAETKESRIRQLQKIHFKSIMNARFVNIGAAPYYTILSKDWNAEPSKLFVGFPSWKITKKI
jgi:hypothetical protein